MRRIVLKALTCTLALAGVVWLFRSSKPPLLGSYSFSRAVYDRNGRLLRLTLAEDGAYRQFVPLGDISQRLKEATLLYEDQHFYRHPGFNPVALINAGVKTYLRGGSRAGGSTITMQVARMYYHLDTRTVVGKLSQILHAVQLELYFSKDELLEAYLNLAPYGGNVEGVAAASLIYFRKAPSELTMAEALALAVVPQRPSERAPHSRQNQAGREQARKRLARAWRERHPSSPELSGLSRPITFSTSSELPFAAPHLVEDALQTTRAGRVDTTIDLSIQQLIERKVSGYIERNRPRGIDNASVLWVDVATREVRAAVGSADFFNTDIDGQVNGTRAKRSPGSALKPLIYGLALEQGLIHPKSLLKDAPMRFGTYRPENFDHEYAGPLSATEALVRSRNVPAVHLETQLRNGGLYGLLQRAQISKLRPRQEYGAAIVLGAAEVTLEELAQLYAALADFGIYRPLKKWNGAGPVRAIQLMSPEAATLTLWMLQSNSRGNERWLDIQDGLDVAWKTGTSFGFRDAWTVGAWRGHVLAVWVGNFSGQGNPSFTGRDAAAPLFFELLEALRPLVKEDLAQRPPFARLETVEVCALSGGVPTPRCPHRTQVSIIPGVSPIRKCDIHREVHVVRATGLRACAVDPSRTEPRVYEVWPSDLAHLFERAGLARRQPPPYEPRCELAQVGQGPAKPPEMTSPQDGLVYNVRPSDLEAPTIPLTAVADADVRELRWFVDNEFLGSGGNGRPMFWKPVPGTHRVRVVDDRGHGDSATIQVALLP